MALKFITEIIIVFILISSVPAIIQEHREAKAENQNIFKKWYVCLWFAVLLYLAFGMTITIIR